MSTITPAKKLTPKARISSMAAKALVSEVDRRIYESNKKEVKKFDDELKGSSAYKKLVSVCDNIRTLEKERQKLKNILSKGNDKIRVSIYNDASYRVDACSSKLDNDKIRNMIVIASHIHGVDINKLVDHVVAELSKS